MTSLPIAWSIAGSDPGGGAGIQADLKTMNALGVHGCAVIAALTAQNTCGVTSIEHPSSAMLRAQLDALVSDLPPAALKLGMLGGPESLHIISDALIRLRDSACDKKPFVVCDPLLVSTSGQSLLPEESLDALRDVLFPQVDLLTPNIPEACRLTGLAGPFRKAGEITPDKLMADPAAEEAFVLEAAHRLLAMGTRSVLIKGGHASGAFCQDYWTNGRDAFWLSGPRWDSRHGHGTGCTLSAAVTACVALGFDVRDALVIARSYVSQGIRQAPGLGAGRGPLRHAGWPDNPDDLPWMTPTACEGRSRYRFPDCGPEPLGFYPIVPNADWVERLLTLGVSTIQLRNKQLAGDALELEIARACAAARRTGARLFINDYWELAVRHGAYGVHLGQDDLRTADLARLEAAGIRLGLSTHCYWEVARALACRPSYIAIGPVFPTTTKVMRFAPQGVGALRRWRALLPDIPLVAIGGIFLSNAVDVLETGVDGVAVVRDILNAPDPDAQVARWADLLTSSGSRRQIPVH